MKIKEKIKLIILLTKIIDMKNWKTTLTGIFTQLPTILTWFGVPIPPEVAHGISVCGIFIIGLVAKDHNVTGGTAPVK